MNQTRRPLIDRSFGSNFGTLVSLNGATALFSFFTTVALANAIGASLFGDYIFFVAVGQYLMVSVQFGTDRTLVRDLVRNPAAFQQTTYGVVALGMAVLLLVGSAVAGGLIAMGVAEVGGLLIMSAIGLRGISLGGLFDVLGRMREHAIITTLDRIAYLGMIWLLLLTMRDQISLVAIGLASMGAGLAALVGQFLRIDLAGQRFAARGVYETAARIVKTNSWLLVSALAALTTGSLSKIVIRPLLGSADLGAFGAAWQVVVAISIVTTQMLRVGMPRLSRLIEGCPTRTEVRRFLLTYGLVTVTSAALVALPAAIFPDYLVRSIFSAEFVQAGGPLRVLAMMAMVVALGQVAHQYLVVVGRERATGGIALASAAISPPLLFLLIPMYGLLGAAWAVLLASSFSALTACVFVWQDLGRFA